MAEPMNVIENLDVLGVSSAFMNPEVVAAVSEYLESHGITNAFVAEKIGMSPQAFGQTLNGKRKMSTEEYIKVCAALEKDLDCFILKEE